MFGLEPKIIEDIKNILFKYDKIEKGVVFGSRARGDNKYTSDIDIAIFSEHISSTELNLIRDEIDMLDIIYKVDIVHFNSLTKEKLMDNILKEGITIYTKKYN